MPIFRISLNFMNFDSVPLFPHLLPINRFSLIFNTLEIRNSSHRGHSVPDANVVPVSSTFDVIDLMNLGQKNRAVGATALNDRSSRSHRYECNCLYKSVDVSMIVSIFKLMFTLLF